MNSQKLLPEIVQPLIETEAEPDRAMLILDDERGQLAQHVERQIS